MDVVPLTLPKANLYVGLWHRHHAPMPSGYSWFCLAAVAETRIVSVAICGRPTNRNNDDGQTVEVLRLASDGTFDACSFLYGAAARVAAAMGAALIITYTLDEESGASLRGAGWIQEKSGIRSWWTTPTPGRSAGVERPHSGLTKARWVKPLQPFVEITATPQPVSMTQEAML